MALVAPAVRAVAAPERPAVLARQGAVFVVHPAQGAVLAQRVVAFAVRASQVAVLAQRVAVFAVRPALAVRLAADSVQPPAAWTARFAVRSVTRAEWAQAGSGGQYRPVGGRSPAERRAVLLPAERPAASAARAVLIVVRARAQAVANAVPAAVVAAEARLSLAAAEEVAAPLAVRAEAARLAAAELAASRGGAEAAALLLARERRPEAFWARRQAERPPASQRRAPALAQGV